MKSQDSYSSVNDLYLELELISPDSRPLSPRRLNLARMWQTIGKRFDLNRLWIALMNNALENSEPKIYRRCDRQGNCYFEVYDPMTGHHCTLGSEQEVRSWLEERYHQ